MYHHRNNFLHRPDSCFSGFLPGAVFGSCDSPRVTGLHLDALAEIYLVDLWQMQLTEESKVSGGNNLLGERGGSALRSLHMNQLKKLANCYDNNSDGFVTVRF